MYGFVNVFIGGDKMFIFEYYINFVVLFYFDFIVIGIFFDN